MAKLSGGQKAVNQRVKKVYDFLKSTNVISTAGEFCAAVGLEASNFSKYWKEDGKAMSISSDVLANITKKYNISSAFLLLGEGDMMVQAQGKDGDFTNNSQFASNNRDVTQTSGSYNNVGQSGGNSNMGSGSLSLASDSELEKELAKCNIRLKALVEYMKSEGKDASWIYNI